MAIDVYEYVVYTVNNVTMPGKSTVEFPQVLRQGTLVAHGFQDANRRTVLRIEELETYWPKEAIRIQIRAFNGHRGHVG